MKKEKAYYMYLVLLLLFIQFYDAYSSELFNRVQSLYLEEFLMKKMSWSGEEALAYFSKCMLPCYLFIMLAPACRALADYYGRKKLLMVSVIGILVGSGICANAGSIYIFLLGNMILNFSNSLDIHNLYIIEEIPKWKQGSIRGIIGGIGALAALSIPFLRIIFVNDNSSGWRSLYHVVVILGFIIMVAVCFVNETTAFCSMKQSSCKHAWKGKSISEGAKAFVQISKNMWISKKGFVLLLFVYGIATAGITFYNEPLLSFSGLSEGMVDRVLMVQPIVCCVVLILGGRLADRFGFKRVIVSMVFLALAACIGFVAMKGTGDAWIAIGICYGVMMGGYWSAYHLIELSALKEITIQRRGGGSAIITYVNGVGNAIGIGVLTILLHFFPLPVIKLLLVAPSLLISVFILLKLHISNH